MTEQPFRNSRYSQPYVAIAVAVTMEEFGIVDALTDEVYAWLERNDVAPAGPSFVRILTSDMSAKLDIEVGVPIDAEVGVPGVVAVTGDDRLKVGFIPSGEYVSLYYSAEDGEDHYQANVDIQAWAANEGVEWLIDRRSGVDVWSGRFTFERPDKSSEGHQVFEVTYQIGDHVIA